MCISYKQLLTQHTTNILTGLLGKNFNILLTDATTITINITC